MYCWWWPYILLHEKPTFVTCCFTETDWDYLVLVKQSCMTHLLSLVHAVAGDGALATSGSAAQVSSESTDDGCATCGGHGELIICDGCSRAFHLECANLASVPPGEWQNHTDQAALQMIEPYGVLAPVVQYKFFKSGGTWHLLLHRLVSCCARMMGPAPCNNTVSKIMWDLWKTCCFMQHSYSVHQLLDKSVHYTDLHTIYPLAKTQSKASGSCSNATCITLFHNYEPRCCCQSRGFASPICSLWCAAVASTISVHIAGFSLLGCQLGFFNKFHSVVAKLKMWKALIRLRWEHKFQCQFQLLDAAVLIPMCVFLLGNWYCALCSGQQSKTLQFSLDWTSPD